MTTSHHCSGPAQLKGADPVPPGSLGQSGTVIGNGAVQQVGQRILQPLVVAVGVGQASGRQAGRPSASLHRQASPCRKVTLRRESAGSAAADGPVHPHSGLCRVAGGQVEIFPPCPRPWLSGREEGTHRFADAGGAWQNSRVPPFCSALPAAQADRSPGNGALSGTVSWKRKLQGPKAPVPGFHPVQLPPCPGRYCRSKSLKNTSSSAAEKSGYSG